METIAATATAVPPHAMPREAVKQAVQAIFPREPRKMAALLAIYDNACVEQRFSVYPLDYIIRPRSLSQTMQEYQLHAVALARQVVADCLARAALRPADVDLIISVSCTGYMIPSLDAYLVHELGFRGNVRRLPITELGCVGGAAALARARDFARAFPDANVLVVAVELSSLTFQPADQTGANLVSCALFGDGAAAALITGRAVDGVQIVDTESCLLPGTLDAMGFDLRDDGFHMVLSRDVPDLLRGHTRDLLCDLLARNDLTLDQVAAFVLHPGGKKILEYLEVELGLSRAATQPSWDVLRTYGNLSSATILFVLHQWSTSQRPAPGTYGLAMGFGPGLSAESLLLRWK